jgi:hypothetical protein
MIILKNWRTITTEEVNEYTPPELIFLKLQGDVYGHPRSDLADGENVITSRIVELDVEKRVAKTYSGHWYKLDSPDKKWLQWLRDNFGNEYLGNMFPN